MSILIFIVVLLVLVIAHEFGHFIVAKKAGIRVDEFAFGFPPRIWSFTKGETKYSFNLLPIGGYVKIFGENPDDVGESSDKLRSFSVQPKLVQASVIVAGVIFNILLAWLLLTGTLMLGIQAPVEEGGAHTLTKPELMITGVHEGSPADTSGLVAGDVIVSLFDGADTLEATSPEAVSGYIAPREGRPITISYKRGGVPQEIMMTPISGIVPGSGAIGIYMDMVGTLKLPIHLALIEAAKRTYAYTEMTIVGMAVFFGEIFSGQPDFTQVTGPVGIVNAVDDAAGLGIANLLLFTAVISINLAVINLIPFPALDGGRLLFVVVESISRKAIPTKVANGLNLAGFAFLMLLMILVTWHDVAKLMQ
jgi:regulator of sigma E protease